MKKIVNVILSTLIMLSIFTNTIFAQENILLEYEENEKLAEKLGVELQDYLTIENNEETLADDELDFKRINESLTASEVVDRDLPSEINIDLFNPLVLYFNTKDGIVIKDVDWYLEGNAFSEPHKMEGKLTNSNLLFIPSVAYRYGDEFYIEATFRYYDYINKQEGTGFTGTTKIKVDSSITETQSQIVNVGDFTIFPGQSIDLDLLGIGKGNISLSKDGKNITLNNVEFSYDQYDLYADRVLTMNKGIAYYSFVNQLENININLIGENKIANMFRNTNTDEDGATFVVSVDGQGKDFVFDPNINILGPGSLEVYGGKYCIEGFGNVVIDTKLKLSSSKYYKENYDTPARIGNGILCVAATLKDNAEVDMDIAGTGIDASLMVDDNYGDIEIKKGAKLNIVNNNYVRHPYEEMFLPSKTNGLVFTDELTIDGASVDMQFIADAKLFKLYKELYGEIPDPYIATGISSANRNSGNTMTNINDSELNISIKTINVLPEEEFQLIRAYGIDTADTKSTVEREHSKINIKDSLLNFDLGDDEHVYTSIGLRASDVSLINSDINIKTKASGEAYGIFLNEKASEEHVIPFVLEVEDSDVFIESSTGLLEGKGYGVLGGQVYFTYNDETKSFEVNAKDATIACYMGKGEEERFNEKNYKPSRISLIDDTGIVDDLPINVFSLTSALNSVVSESSKPKEIMDNNELSSDGYINNFISEVYCLENQNDELEESLEATSTYKYYETIFKNGEIAPLAIIKKIAYSPTPKKPSINYSIPKTGVK